MFFLFAPLCRRRSGSLIPHITFALCDYSTVEKGGQSGHISETPMHFPCIRLAHFKDCTGAGQLFRRVAFS